MKTVLRFFVVCCVVLTAGQARAQPPVPGGIGYPGTATMMAPPGGVPGFWGGYAPPSAAPAPCPYPGYCPQPMMPRPAASAPAPPQPPSMPMPPGLPPGPAAGLIPANFMAPAGPGCGLPLPPPGVDAGPPPPCDPPCGPCDCLDAASFSPFMLGDAFGRGGIPLRVTSVFGRTYRLLVPSPTGGGVVGRTKVSDGNNPQPRDRIIFDYDYFNNAALSVGGFDVNRFSVGFEKTFFNRWASIELRVPFASTLRSNIESNSANGTRTEVGDIHVTLKALLVRGDTHNISTGAGLALPTANKTRIFADGVEMLRIKNDTPVVTPFVAWLYTPNDTFFLQSWTSVAYNTNRNGMLVNNGLALVDVGHFKEQALFQFDTQLGFWAMGPRNDGWFLRGIAPFVETHYNSALGNAGRFSIPTLTLAYPSNSFNELNVALGASFLLGDRVLLSAGAVFPVLGSTANHRTFDYQVGIRGSIFFGPTWRNLTASSLISTF